MANESRSIACTFCRKRKRKCDGQTPCSICRRYNKTGACEYPTDKDKRKWKYDSTYVDYLELKADILQQFANELIRSDHSKAKTINRDLISSIMSHNTMPKAQSSNTSAETLLKGLADENAIDELVSTTWRVRQDHKGHTEFYGPISGRQQVIEDSEEELENISPNKNIDFVQSSKEFRHSLLGIFKTNFAQFFYISLLDNEDLKNWDYPSSDISKQFLLCAIFTYSSLFTNHRDLSFSFLQEAEVLCMKACRNVNEYVLQGLLILSCFELGMGLDSNSWAFNAMTSAFTQYMKLHLEEVPTPGNNNDNNNSLISLSPRKTSMFWSIILQDRIITSVLGRGCRIQYFRIKTPFYSPLLTDKSNEHYLTELSFAYHSKLWYIHDRSIGQIYSFKADYLHNSHRSILMNQGMEALDEWKASLPLDLKLTPETIDTRILIVHLSFSVVYLLLHRAYLKQIPLKVIQVTIEQCTIASNIIQRISNNNLIFKDSPRPYFVSYLILTCATFDLFLLSNKDESLKPSALNRIQIYIDSLLDFGKIWRRGNKDIQVLGALAKRWKLKIPYLDQALLMVQDTDKMFMNESFDYGYINEDYTIHANNFFNQFQSESEPMSMDS